MKKRLHPFWYELSPEQRWTILNGAYGRIARDMERRHTTPAHLHFDDEARRTIDELLFGEDAPHRKA